jgi:AcrR family transcriptional regulator
MVRTGQEGRLDDIAAAASRVFRRQGFRRALVGDVAREAGVASGTVYLYASSKEALFDLALRYAIDGSLPATEELPVGTPAPGEALALVDKWLTDVVRYARLESAPARKPKDPRAELAGIVEERYRIVEDNRRLIALIERSALDLPDLAELYFRRARRGQVEMLAAYIERRARQGVFRAVPDAATAARFIVETIAWFAWHRRGDPDSAMIDDDVARSTVIDLICAALVAS